MYCVALTGGIGTGKSLASRLFAELGVDIIDTDVIARQLLEKDGALFDVVCSHFGHKILEPDGSINRKALRHIIFSDPSQKKWLEDLMHPAIREHAYQALQKSTSPYAIMVIPLLAEADPAHYPFLDRVCVIHSLEELQIERTMKRDQISRDDAIRIIKHQAPHEKRMALATDVIENNGDEAEVAETVNALHLHYLKLAGE
jgi:dephospho-CoA kinase